MKPSITWANNKIKVFLSILFWLGVWQIAAFMVGKEVLLPSPSTTLKALINLCVQSAFWHTISFSIIRIIAGFLLAVLFGVVLAILSANSEILRMLFSPLFSVVKSVPVASFIILILLWVKSRNLSICISFLMVLPVIYTNVLEGLLQVDKKLLEMAKVFRIAPLKKILYIYIPQILPYFTAACTTALGLCWKSGIAAEVIGLPNGSIGNRLYESKLYFDTPQMFAWTVVIVIISFVAEKGFLYLLSKFTEKIKKGFL